jgi:hypothetical protein
VVVTHQDVRESFEGREIFLYYFGLVGRPLVGHSFVASRAVGFSSGLATGPPSSVSFLSSSPLASSSGSESILGAASVRPRHLGPFPVLRVHGLSLQSSLIRTDLQKHWCSWQGMHAKGLEVNRSGDSCLGLRSAKA